MERMRKFLQLLLLATITPSTSAVAQAQDFTLAPVPFDQTEVSPEIIGGYKPKVEDWQASLIFKKDPNSDSYCTSTIIGERAVITAAHCIKNGAKGIVEFGTIKIGLQCTHHEEYQASCLTNQYRLSGCTADVAICKADQAFRDATVFPDLRYEAISTDPTRLRLNQQIVVAGYGCIQTVGDNGKFFIGTANVSHLPNPEAATDPEDPLKRYLQTVQGAAICSGDSGGLAYDVVNPTSRSAVAINSRSWNAQGEGSYLVSLSDKRIERFLLNWSARERVLICGLHSDAVGCRGS